MKRKKYRLHRSWENIIFTLEREDFRYASSLSPLLLMQHIYIHSLIPCIFSCSFLLISRPATTIIIMMQLNLIDNFFLVCSHHPISSFFLCKNIHQTHLAFFLYSLPLLRISCFLPTTTSNRHRHFFSTPNFTTPWRKRISATPSSSTVIWCWAILCNSLSPPYTTHTTKTNYLTMHLCFFHATMLLLSLNGKKNVYFVLIIVLQRSSWIILFTSFA